MKTPVLNMLFVGNQKEYIILSLHITLLHSTFLPTIKCFEYIIGIQFNKTPLVVEQNN